MHLVIDKLTRRLADHPVLVRKIFGSENVARLGDQKLTALHILFFHLYFHDCFPIFNAEVAENAEFQKVFYISAVSASSAFETNSISQISLQHPCRRRRTL